MNIYHIMEYLPTRYSGTSNQVADRKAVWNFKDGYCSASILSGLASRVSDIAGYCKDDFVICFVPASTSDKTRRRYGSVASQLQRMTGVRALVDAIYKPLDGESGHIAGKVSDPAVGFSFRQEHIRGKNVILVDDVVTRGNTMYCTARRLYQLGVTSVTGLCVAKTINPDWVA